MAHDGHSNRSRYDLRDQVGFVLRLVFQHHSAVFTSRMIGDLTQTQFAALWTLRSVGRCSQNKLGRLIALDSATIRGVVARLQGRGLVATTEDGRDRRRLVLTVTFEGAALLDAAEPVATAITEATLVQLSRAERKQLMALLGKIVTSPDGHGPSERSAPSGAPTKGA